MLCDAAVLAGIFACVNLPLRSVVRKPCADGSNNASVLRREEVVMVGLRKNEQSYDGPGSAGILRCDYGRRMQANKYDIQPQKEIDREVTARLGQSEPVARHRTITNCSVSTRHTE